MEMAKSTAGNCRAADAGIPEELLIQRVLAGETDLYGILAERYSSCIFRRVRRLVRNETDAEDIVQNTHLRALTYLYQFGGRCKFVTWLSRVADNAAFNHLRQQRLAQRISAIFEHSVTTPTLVYGFRDPETCVQDSELREGLCRALAKLPPRYRVVFLLREVGQMKTPEIARSLRIRSDNVRVKLYRARRMLRETICDSPQ
jgi:RNA polymerase sigma factor (sigma-70 family)